MYMPKTHLYYDLLTSSTNINIEPLGEIMVCNA